MTALKSSKQAAAHTPEWERYTENRFFVYDSIYSNICRAAQPTFYGALQYMKPGRVIVTEPRT